MCVCGGGGWGRKGIHLFQTALKNIFCVCAGGGGGAGEVGEVGAGIHIF